MARDLGMKHACYSCGTKFYDLHRPEPICPKCGADQRESPAHATPPEKRRHAKPAVVAEPAEDAEVAVVPEALDDEDEELEADEDAAEEAADEEV